MAADPRLPPALDGGPLAELLEGIADAAPRGPQPDLRERLRRRIGAAIETSRGMRTLRTRDLAVHRPAVGVSLTPLHEGDAESLRAGEPLCSALIGLAPGAEWTLTRGPAHGVRREWLLVEGDVAIGGRRLEPLGWLEGPAETPAVLRSRKGGWLHLRETPCGAPPSQRHEPDRPALWHDFAPGIRRRLLWDDGHQAAMLYRADPGAAVPGHRHGHDEECLMLAGEVFLDDILLRRGEYQLAPAGTRHGGVATDTGALIYAHGDLNLQIDPPTG